MNCNQHPDAGIRRGSVGSHNVCNMCGRPVCQDCGKPEEIAWLSGVCDSCYRDRERAERHRQAQSRAEERDRVAKLEEDLRLLREAGRDVVDSFEEIERRAEQLYDASTHRCVNNLAKLLR